MQIVEKLFTAGPWVRAGKLAFSPAVNTCVAPTLSLNKTGLLHLWSFHLVGETGIKQLHKSWFKVTDFWAPLQNLFK